MDISKMKKVALGGGDGQTVAMIVDNTAYCIQCDGMGDALQLMNRKYGIHTSDWMLSNDKAVLIPGLWEFEMAVCIKDMDNVQTEQLAEQLKLNAEVA